MNATSQNPEFMKTIEDIRSAEKEYESTLTKAREKAEKVLRDAKEKVHDEREKTEKEIVELKNERLRKGSKGIEADVQKMVDEAKDEADGISSKKLNKKDVSKLVKDFIAGL
jgi:vacuolar-type H+-ATPase subunit H